jgi:hypothetical protein
VPVPIERKCNVEGKIINMGRHGTKSSTCRNSNNYYNRRTGWWPSRVPCRYVSLPDELLQKQQRHLEQESSIIPNTFQHLIVLVIFSLFKNEVVTLVAPVLFAAIRLGTKQAERQRVERMTMMRPYFRRVRTMTSTLAYPNVVFVVAH